MNNDIGDVVQQGAMMFQLKQRLVKLEGRMNGLEKTVNGLEHDNYGNKENVNDRNYGNKENNMLGGNKKRRRTNKKRTNKKRTNKKRRQ